MASEKPQGILNLKDMFTINSIFFFIITTTIAVLTSYFGTSFIQELSTNNTIQIGFNAIVFFIYFMVFAMYYLHWSFQSIVFVILAISVLFTVISFLIIYFGADACEEVESLGFQNVLHYLMVILLFLIFYLGIHNRNNYQNWTSYDTGRFILILVLARLMYYLMDKYDLQSYKTPLNIILLIVFYYNLKRIYNVWMSPTTQSPTRNKPPSTNL